MTIPIAERAIADRIASVHERIARAAERARRDPAGVTLIAVSKRQPVEAVFAALAAGQRAFGENYVQEGVARESQIAASAHHLQPVDLHLIGHLQRNKARVAATTFAILHTVDSESLLDALAGLGHSHPISILVQVNLAGEATKHGVSPEALPAMVNHARSLPGVDLLGLMTIPPPARDPEDARPAFQRLRALAETHGLRDLSMGMSADFEVAIEEGATFVRVGQTIFGERQ